VEARQLAAWRRMTPAEKLQVVSELVRASEELALAGIRQRHPHATGRELELRLAALRLDRETMVRWLGWDPEREGDFAAERADPRAARGGRRARLDRSSAPARTRAPRTGARLTSR
jgi:hypothetical protein